ncbi:MAG: zinc-dependent alcohol dehydrogenase family protein [Chloroflexota bacterium]
MKAAICYTYDRPLTIEDVQIDAPQHGEVRVRMLATAICHSDIHYIRGERDARTPLVVGHEGAGIVEETGSGVERVNRGDFVVMSLLRSCGRCYHCVRGAPFHCEGTFALQTETRLHTRGGQPLWDGQLGCSAFAEKCVVDQSQVVRVPREIPADRAALLACGVITGLGAVVNTARVEPGSSVVVIGTGGVGLNAVQGAALAGAHHIIALDTLDTKLEAAREFGATLTLDAARGDVVDVVRSLTAGRGADYVFVTVGHGDAVRQGLSLTRTAGTLVMVGLPGPGVTIPLPIRDVAWAGQRILGSCMGSTRLSIDVPWLANLYQEGRLKLDELITARYPLERINEAIDTVEAGTARRNVIMFNA